MFLDVYNEPIQRRICGDFIVGSLKVCNCFVFGLTLKFSKSITIRPALFRPNLFIRKTERESSSTLTRLMRHSEGMTKQRISCRHSIFILVKFFPVQIPITSNEWKEFCIAFYQLLFIYILLKLNSTNVQLKDLSSPTG